MKAKPKIRLHTQRIRINGVNRYAVFDHTGEIWIYHRPDMAGIVQSSRYMFMSHDELNTEKDEEIAWVLERTGGSPDDALGKHAPLPKEYEILALDTAIKRLCLRKVGAEDLRDEIRCYVLESTCQPFCVNSDRLKQYYTIHPLNGGVLHVLYSVIEQITFEDV